MLYCTECGAVFDESDLATWEESRGEFWGQPCYETLSGCPCCSCTDVINYDEYLKEQEKDGENK